MAKQVKDPATPVAPRGGASPQAERWRPRWSRALFESVLIVFSVLLALLLNEWRDNRKQVALSATAITAIVAELERNKTAATRAMEFHSKINATLSDLVARGEKPSVELARSGLFNPATLLDTAWASAQQTGALDDWPYESILSVARVYERQALYGTLARDLVADLYMDLRRRGIEDVMQEGVGGMILLTFDFTSRERELVQQYYTALAAIGSQDR